jgi:hypothetical protein
MATPSEKSPAMEGFLARAFGRTTAIESDTCAVCKKPATEFDDELSRKEYTISGLCQWCQGEIFEYGEDDDEV